MYKHIHQIKHWILYMYMKIENSYSFISTLTPTKVKETFRDIFDVSQKIGLLFCSYAAECFDCNAKVGSNMG
jgi:hypothetical protein